ncbi:adhesion G-protein coupled receptor G5 isoform X2 [Emydura macquarii macquarii]|uniref:adhesion G-protein coupled receptor G5 isoform X2 n=1 Tax=Emydura macquarii macquarii TaxID=1129001 RepID=UPI00352ACF05
MSCIWNHTGMDSPLWTCIFLYLVALLLQPSEEAQNCQDSRIPPGTAEDRGMPEVNSIMAEMNNQLKEGCSASSRKLVGLKPLERKLLEANFPEENITFRRSHVKTLVFKIEPTKFQGMTVSSNWTKSGNETQHSMSFPAELVRKVKLQPRTRKVKLACIYLKASCLFQDGKNSSLLNNDILGATLETFNITNLTNPVEIRFWHDNVSNNTTMTCVFWVEGTEGSNLGSWSSVGCETNRKEGMVLCKCNHLTYFAVLLQISSAAIDEALLAPLTYITMVGCSISAVASLLAILLYLVSRKKSSNYSTKIHMNLLGALFLLNVSFLLSEPLASVTPRWLCRGTAACLHYSLLCSLTWMAIEGFHLYLLLIKVYNVYIRRYILKLCAIGWGLPALAVVSILLIKKEIYGPLVIETDTKYHNATMCWVTDWHVHYILNLGYTALTVLFNMVILVIVTRMMQALRSNMHNQREQVKKDIVSVLGLTCLLGTTWALAFLSFGAFLIPQLFLFTIINSLQGFFICLWYCTMRRQPDDTSSSSRSTQMTK